MVREAIVACLYLFVGGFDFGCLKGRFADQLGETESTY